MRKLSYLTSINFNDKYYYLNHLNGSILKLNKSLDDINEDKELSGRFKSFCPGEADEIEMFEFWNSKFRYNNDFQISLVLTEECNLRCTYCYQKEKKKKRIDFILSDQFIKFIKLNTTISKNIHIEFYGGEPLLNSEILDYIASSISDYCTENKINFTFGIMTNAVYIDIKHIKKLKELGLTSIQLTLDGSESVHNKKRCYRGGKGTFSSIINNLLELVEVITPVVRINVDKENIYSIKELLLYLKQMSLHEKIYIYFTPLMSEKQERACATMSCTLALT